LGEVENWWWEVGWGGVGECVLGGMGGERSCWLMSEVKHREWMEGLESAVLINGALAMRLKSEMLMLERWSV